MATSWGIDPLKDVNGIVTMGTTAADFRQIQGALYSPGLISGGLVTRSASAMTYTVSNGVAAYPIVTGTNPQTVLGPVISGVVNTTAPVSGTRVDIVYATQRTVAVNGDPAIVLGVGTTLPANSVMLDAFIVSSSNTNTNAAVRQADIKYSIPYGASMGLLVNRKSTFVGGFSVSSNDLSGSIYVPTTRLLRVSLQAGLSSQNAVGFDNSKYCEAGYDIYIDEVKKFGWTSQGLHQAWAETFWSDTIELPAGSHTYRTVRYRAAGTGMCMARGGAIFQIQDVGPA
jgi:hypothetical protein